MVTVAGVPHFFARPSYSGAVLVVECNLNRQVVSEELLRGVHPKFPLYL
jgi:hypothetical protein